MSIKDLASDLVLAQRKKNPCKTCEYLDTLSPGVEKDQVKAALDGSLSAYKVAQIFRKHGIGVGKDAILRHREHLSQETS